MLWAAPSVAKICTRRPELESDLNEPQWTLGEELSRIDGIRGPPPLNGSKRCMVGGSKEMTPRGTQVLFTWNAVDQGREEQACRRAKKGQRRRAS